MPSNASVQELELLMRRLDFAMNTIVTIPIFTGDRRVQENFTRQMYVAINHVKEIQTSAKVKLDLDFQFMNRISVDVQRDARLNINMKRDEARIRL